MNADCNNPELRTAMQKIFDAPSVARPPKYVSVEKGIATFLDETGHQVGQMSEETYKVIVEKFRKTQ